ncbi:uncharacterized protein LAESUDRAFT_373254 [Laetiporus sulphureus 93-53]|uniref:Pentacotripeptide-repeat region of PRORP domain-containing protein n=1 Tax=Laetiporus sulphureus 93-53 TaxID=1314785 RepID=A0A165CRM2_9APHY|nr:uncharacterized protein LAESUDRAFT_373254 [Laetiporus sulphureus 93-53]KZT03306.1 hypothetical protein LAESUDRAFT_373254 [Laetiporus sulphureus 93-53]
MWVNGFVRAPTKSPFRAFSVVAEKTKSLQPYTPATTSRHAGLMTRLYRVSRYYGRKCDDPLFDSLNWLARFPAGFLPVYTLNRSGIHVNQMKRWRPLVMAANWNASMEFIADKDIVIPALDLTRHPSVPTPSSSKTLPTWLVFHLLCSQVATEEDALQALALAYHHFPSTPIHMQPMLFIITACWLAEHSLFVPLRRVVAAFLDFYEHVPPHEHEFWAMLQMLAYASASKEVSIPACAIIRAMDKHNLRLNQATVSALLGSAFVTTILGRVLMRRIVRHDFEPTVQHLTRLLRVFEYAKRRSDARRCLSLLNVHLPSGFRVPPSSRKVSRLFIKPGPTTIKSEARYLLGFHSVDELLQYLQKKSSPQDALPARSKEHKQRSSASSRDGTPSSHSAAEETGRNDASPVPHRRAGNIMSTHVVWRNSLLVAARDRKMRSENILPMLHQAQSQHPLLHREMLFIVFSMRALIVRNDYVNALRIWDRIKNNTAAMNRFTVSAGVEALVMGGRASEAVKLLLSISERKQSTQSLGSTTNALDVSQSGLNPRTRLDTQSINVLMRCLQRTGRYDTIFVLWEQLEPLFDVRPDHYTLTILLRTARLAGKCNPSIRGVLVEMGLGRLLKPPPGSKTFSARGAQILNMIYSNRPSTGVWNGERAGQVTLKIVNEIMMESWPELREVKSPIYATRPSGDFCAFFPVTDFYRTVMGREVSVAEENTNSTSPAPPSNVPSVFSQIIPNDVFFRAYIELLAAESLIPHIPLVLAWMRRLNVKPSQRTVATVLVYWAEVGMDPPLFEHVLSGKSQYERLMDWLCEWVGPSHMPTDKDMDRSIMRLKKFRELRYAFVHRSR